MQGSKDMFRRFASQEMTKLTLSQYYTAGRYLLKHRNRGGKAGHSASQLTAQFLYRELPIRIGQTAQGFNQTTSPYHLSRLPHFGTLVSDYMDDFKLLVDGTAAPNTPESNAVFVDTLRCLKRKYRANMWNLSQGLRELSSAILEGDREIVPDFLLKSPNGEDKRRRNTYLSSTMAYPALSAPMMYLAPSGKMEMTDPSKWGAASLEGWTPNRVCQEFCQEADCRNPRLWVADHGRRCAERQTRRFFDWLYAMNLGTQLLVEDHVAIHDYGHSLVRIIAPLEVAQRAAKDASRICQKHYGFEPPEIKIIATRPSVTTTYVPHYLYSMLFQLLKNALRATIENTKGQFSMVKLVMSKGEEDVTFKVSDEGGGIPLSQVDAIWSYLKTTNCAIRPQSDQKNSTSSALSSVTFMQRPRSDMPLFGAGDGLPMARQIARYFGGDLDLVSMEGVGTDAYLHLSRRNNTVEHADDLSTLLETSLP